MQSNPYQQQPYGYPQQGYQQQQTGRNYQTGLASPGYPQYGQSYAQGLAGNAAYQDENDIYNVNIPSAFERLKALRKTNPRRQPVIVKPKPRPAPKVSKPYYCSAIHFILYVYTAKDASIAINKSISGCVPWLVIAC